MNQLKKEAAYNSKDKSDQKLNRFIFGENLAVQEITSLLIKIVPGTTPLDS